MLFEKFIDKDLGHVSYIIACEESLEAMLVDPRRDIDCYINYLDENNLNLKFILNTHMHADYVGGHLEIVNMCPNSINIFYKNVDVCFNFCKVQDGDVFRIGKINLHIIHTPGHTPNCISCIVEENGVKKYIFTGDILFVGDMARPDLLGNMMLNDLLEMSYNTACKFWDLSDDLIIFPSHIKGSFCGKDLKSQYFSTIGIEKKTNSSFALSKKSKEEYIENLKNQNLETPIFFKRMVYVNIKGPTLLKDIENVKYMNEIDFFNYYNPNEDYIIDFRHPNCFLNSHIKGSINVYEYSNIALIIGSLLENDSNLFLVGDIKTNFDVILKKLRRIGFDSIKAILKSDIHNIDGLVVFNNSPDLKKEKIINLEKAAKVGDINIEISQIRTLNLNDNVYYKIVCKNGYKSIAVQTFLEKLKIMKKKEWYEN